MPDDLLFLPEGVTGGLGDETVTLLVLADDAELRELRRVFAPLARRGRVRASRARPPDGDGVVALEEWEANQGMSTLRWEALTATNAGFLISNYGFLSPQEELVVQPIVWEVMLRTNHWVQSLSNVISTLRHRERHADVSGLRQACDPAQRSAVTAAMVRLAMRFDHEWRYDTCVTHDDRVHIERVLSAWRAQPRG